VVRSPSSAPTNRSRLIWSVSAVGAVTAAAIFVLIVRTQRAPDLHIPFFVLVALFAVSEVAVLHIEVGPKGHTHSFVEVPLVLGLLAMAPSELVGAWLLGGVVTLGVVRRQPPIKLAYNSVSFAVQSVVAVTVFRSIADGRHLLAARTAGGVLASCAAASLISTASVTVAVALADGPEPTTERIRYALFGVMSSAVTAATVLIGVVLQQTDAAALWLLALAVAGVYLMERALTRWIRKLAAANTVASASPPLPSPATHDPLTGLANRTLLADHLDRWLVDRGHSDLACIYIDLDGLESVNERFGHSTGDQLLVVAAQRLAGCLREGDMAARLEGDHFAVMARVDPENRDQEAAALGQRIVALLSRPASLGEHTVVTDAWVGVVLGQDGESAVDILAAVEVAMLATHNASRGGVEDFASDRQPGVVRV
jgi:diguanylate cyclase (GGDEF)-like protein